MIGATAGIRRATGALRVVLAIGVLPLLATGPSVAPHAAPVTAVARGPEPGLPGNTDAELGARLLAAPADSRTVIRLGTTWLWRRDEVPLVVRGHVRIVGRGPTETVIDARYLGHVFDVRPGAVLELESLSLIRGGPTTIGNGAPGDGGPNARVRLTDVLVAANVPTDVADPIAYCLSNDVGDAQYFCDSVLTDPLALQNAPGNAF